MSICCTSRPRLAPSVSRTAVSRCRVAALARSRLATLAQAMSRTMPATASCTPITAVTAAPPMLGARQSSYSFTPLPASSAYVWPSWRMTRSRSASARSSVTPGFSRTMRLEPAIAAHQAIDAVQRRLHHHGHPEVEVQVRFGAAEPFRADADDRERDAVQQNRPADDRRVAIEPATPELVADHRHRMTIRGRPLLVQERAAEKRARAEGREVVDRHELREHALRITVAQAHVQRGERVGDQILDAVRAALAQVGESWQGNVAVRRDR